MSDTFVYRRAGWGLTLYTWAFAGFLVAPIAAAVLLSLSADDSLKFPPSGWSLRWYGAIGELDWLGPSLAKSLIIAAASTVLAAVAGTGAAIAINHYRFRGRSLMQTLVLLPLTLPAVVLGLGQLFLFAGLGWSPGTLTAILGHAVAGIPFVVYLVLSAFANYDLTLEKASANLGASTVATFRRITLPLIAPGIAAGSVFAFLMSFDNVSLSIFITRGDTLPLRLMQQIQFYANPTVAAVSTLIIAGSAVLVVIAGKGLSQGRR